MLPPAAEIHNTIISMPDQVGALIMMPHLRGRYFCDSTKFSIRVLNLAPKYQVLDGIVPGTE